MPSSRRFACAFILAAAVAGAAYAQPGEQTVNLTLSSYAFTPKIIHLRHGAPYRLRLTNTSGKGHDFAAYELFEASRVAPEDRSKIDDGKVEVSKGQSVDVRFTPTKPGTYKIKCTHPFHAMLGMTGEVVVD
ncbi:MAG TPA: cupredoxin domain-containing protein [Caulobacteraceae bacterium]|jgi:uncharacterized cupredoxin-like copper-binding protein|nr:cupredoxin domain-containing protein [Caulobacteraceae bacterium]